MIKIILAEDHEIVRNGIKSLLEVEEDLTVVGEAKNGAEVLSLLESGVFADVILSDVSMPEMDGLALTKAIKQAYPALKVIILSMMDNEKYIFEAFNLGVDGYLLKNTTSDEMVFAIRHVAAGNQIICTELGLRMLKRVSTADFNPKLETPDLTLTSREIEVLKLTADGFTNNEIAERLFTSRRTVEGHRQNLIDKAGVKNTAELIQFAFRAGILK